MKSIRTIDDKTKLLRKLDFEIGYQWKWTKLNQLLNNLCLLLTWFCSTVTLALSATQILITPQIAYIIAIAILSTLAITLPILTWIFKWKPRQELHDVLARRYEVIKMKVETNQIDVASAINQFTQLHKLSPEQMLEHGHTHEARHIGL